MSWLALSSRNQCYNLDFNTQTKKEIIDCYNNNKAKINIIEGNKGLYDGLDLKGSDDNSAMSIFNQKQCRISNRYSRNHSWHSTTSSRLYKF